MAAIRILIVEDEVFIAQDLKACLEKEGFCITGIAYDHAEALSELNKGGIDLVLLDINLEGKQEGITIAESINEQHQIPFLFITSYANSSIVERAKHTKPMGYLVKPYKREDVVAAIRISLYNFAHFSDGFQWKKIEANIGAGIAFTPREKEILRGIYEGLTNQELARNQYVSANTIKTHVKNIYAKLAVHNRAEALIKIRQMLQNSPA